MKLKKLWLALAVCGLTLSATSCDNGDEYYYYDYASANALVTVKHTADRVCYLQLDDSTTLLPTNLSRSPFGEKEVRALANLTLAGNGRSGFSRQVYVNWIDSIRTKDAVHAPANLSVYGNDAVEIVKDWVSIAEDGYLTLRFRTRWGNSQVKHVLNLISGTNASDPYELTFCHNAQGDTLGQWGDALIAFRLKDLPDTQGQTVKLTLKWKSYSGMKSAQFSYRTHQSGGNTDLTIDDRTYTTRLQ